MKLRFLFLKYFHINNTKFNYDLEFKNNSKINFWKQNTPLIEYCETIGITIPHYCYHKNLSISGNCRMCLVELKNSPKPIVSCAMNAKSCLANGDIYTNSTLVKKARENVLEFLLLNHPLDCPICDQGGECDLQDQSLFFGLTKKRFFNFKRIVLNKNLGPIVKTVMTRCIHCTRCVRFATEIAGTDDIGMFGRGLQSEIGTYVNKMFKSELSGNVIDLCPVGALTSKPYPFVNRNWELKNLKSFDFSDGLGTPIQLFIKNNQIVKILPGFEQKIWKTNWITDKTRFAFDGMFSPTRIISNFLQTKKKSFDNLSWQKILKEFFYILYFKTHLSQHYYKPKQITICLGENTSIEVLNLLKALTQKYSFFKLRKSSVHNVNNDLEQNYLLNSSLNDSKIKNSNICLLIGLNPRYEGSKLNLKLRTRHLKGNFKVFTLSSLMDLTFLNTNISSNIKILQSIAEGNSVHCQNFVNASSPLIVTNNEMFQRADSRGLATVLKTLTVNAKIVSKSDTNCVNILSSTLNESGFLNLKNFKTITNKDIKKSCCIFFVNNSFSPNLKKLLNLKLLNFLQKDKATTKMLVTQTNNLDARLVSKIKKNLNLHTHLHFPNANFFETTGTYINTEGNFIKNTKAVASFGQIKTDWQITKKLLSYCSKLLFINDFLKPNKIGFSSSNNYYYKNFISFHYYAISNLNSSAFKLITNSSNQRLLKLFKFKSTQKKLHSSQIRFWLNDFYLDSKDFNHKNSSTMIQCSKLFRLNNTNFKF